MLYIVLFYKLSVNRDQTSLKHKSNVGQVIVENITTVIATLRTTVEITTCWITGNLALSLSIEVWLKEVMYIKFTCLHCSVLVQSQTRNQRVMSSRLDSGHILFSKSALHTVSCGEVASYL